MHVRQNAADILNLVHVQGRRLTLRLLRAGLLKPSHGSGSRTNSRVQVQEDTTDFDFYLGRLSNY